MTTITILCNNPQHPIFHRLQQWVAEQQTQSQEVKLVTGLDELDGGNLLFLVSCSILVSADYRSRYRHTLVLHASDLPQGRGWSPHIWRILEGHDDLIVTLLEAEDKVDTGAIWQQRRLALTGTELWYEINDRLFDAELELMSWAVMNHQRVMPQTQDGEASYYRQRTPADSELSLDLTLAEVMPLLRVSDPQRFPAFVNYRGRRFNVILESADDEYSE